MKGSEKLAQELKLIEESVSLQSPEGRRIAIRSAFAGLEVLVSEICTGLLDKLPPADLESHEQRHQWFLELCALSNISYSIDDKGQLRQEPPKTSLKQRALFALNMRARVTQTQIDPKNDPGWNQFTKATKIRNRITHPKKESDLNVSNDDYSTVVEAIQWFVRYHHRACGGQKY